jgi:ribose transport system substrate-binding protein
VESTSPLDNIPEKTKRSISDSMPPVLMRIVRAREFTLVVMIIVIGLALQGITGRFFTVPNLNAISLGFATSAIIVFGMTAALVSGGFDLSVGSVFAVGGVAVAIALRADIPIPLSMLFGVGVGMLAGFINGLLITQIQINPFITTLGMMGIARGVSLAVTEGTVLAGMPPEFLIYGQEKTFDIPNLILIALLVILIGDILMRRSAAFRQIYYVGGNEEAARLSGINVDLVKIGVYTLSGMLAAFAGVLSVSRFSVADPGSGSGEELRIIAACIIGGCSLRGGRGTVIGGLLGLIFVGFINNGMILLRVPCCWRWALTPSASAGRCAHEARKPAKKPRGHALFIRLALKEKVLMKRRDFLKRSSFAAAAAMLASHGINLARAQGEGQTYYMVTFVSGISYWADAFRGMQDAAEMLGVDVVYTGTPDQDATAEVRVLEETLALEPDGVVLTVIQADALQPTIDGAIDNGIPLVTFDADSPLSKRYAFLGTGNYYAGVIAARYIGPLAQSGIAAVVTNPEQNNLQQRVQGFTDTLAAEFPDIITGPDYIVNNQNTSELAASGLAALLQREPNITGVFSSNAQAAIGAASALREAGMLETVHHIGFDFDEGTLDLIDNGQLGATLAQGTWQMGFWGLLFVYMVRNGLIESVSDWQAAGISPLPPNVDTGVVVINQSNSQFWRAS